MLVYSMSFILFHNLIDVLLEKTSNLHWIVNTITSHESLAILPELICHVKIRLFLHLGRLEALELFLDLSILFAPNMETAIFIFERIV